MPHPRLRFVVFVGLLAAIVLLGVAPPAGARLDPKTWKEVKDDAQQLFGVPGEREAKARVVKLLVEDNERRAWKMLVEALVKEAQVWVEISGKMDEKFKEIHEIESKPMAKRYPEEQDRLPGLKEELAAMEVQSLDQRAILDDITIAVANGPLALRKNLFSRAKGEGAWPVRAAAASVSAMNPTEKLSFEHLSRVMNTDKDPRVRMAALESLRSHLTRARVAAEAAKPAEGEGVPLPEDGGEKEDDDATADLLSTAESLILSRLADKDWGVQILALRIVEEHEMTSAIPHLINALNFAGPRVREAIGQVLRDFTGEKHDAYSDVWAKWWEDHKERFMSEERVKAGKTDRPPSDAHFYGLPVKSDRILFIIDTSSSMKKPTKNENPAEKWKPRAPVTGPGGPPPPPPPEEILSGPKIDVAKHELKKAVQKLPESCMFNIIAFNTGVFQWRDTMQQATAKNKKEALTWIRALTPKGITYIDGALRLAFRMAGIGAMDKRYQDVNVDTMILLSDGAPTDANVGNVQLMKPELILQHVRDWNQNKRIVIHAVGVDMVEGIEFLQKLAAENGGEYLDR